MQTPYGEFTLHCFHDTVTNESHVALTLGEIKADEPVLVRVQTNNILRDVLGVQKPNSESWSANQALQRISAEGKGVLVLLSPNKTPDICEQLDAMFGRVRGPRIKNKDSSGVFLTIGTGSQILRELGVQKMRLLSSEIKFGGISGFNLEITEYLPFTE